MAKTKPPTSKITIYGIEIDSDKMEARLPPVKVVKVMESLREMKGKTQTTLRTL